MSPDEQVGRLLVVGELNADIVVAVDQPPVFGQAERLVPGIEIVLGSSSAITACGAATLSVPTSFVGVVGDDLIGRFVLDELRARGVDVSHCVTRTDLPTGSCVLLTLPSGDRSMLTALGSIAATDVAAVPVELLDRSAHVHVGSYFLQAGLHGPLAAFFAGCRARGLTTSLDPNDDPAGTWDGGIDAVLPEVDVFFCNAAEAVAIAGRPSVEGAIAWFAERLPTGAQLVVKLGERGAAMVTVTDGVAGSRAVVEPRAVRQPLVDTIGAGDSLSAGFLAARLRGLDPLRCLEVGVRNGTASTRAVGGTAGQLTWEEVQRT